LALAFASAFFCAFALGSASAAEVESNTNRAGGDYKDFPMETTIGGFSSCQSSCVFDEKCKAWTFVPSGIQGPKAHCWLKSSVPKATKDKCCTSGLPVRAHGCEIGGKTRMDVLDRDCQEAQTTGCIKRLLNDAQYKSCLRAQPVVSSGCMIGGVNRKNIADRDCREAQKTGCIKRLLTDQQYQDCLKAQKTAGGGGTTTPGGGGTTTTHAPVMTDLLNAHNAKRALHCTPKLQWDQAIADAALAWAKKCTNTHESQDAHPVNPNPSQWGENLMTFRPAGQTKDADALQNSWYCEINWYKFEAPKWAGGSKNGCDPPVNGHFTQLVWKDTTKVGCAKTQCSFGDYWVCKYSKPGNNNVDESRVDHDTAVNSLKANVLPLCK
jgi:hypothetical protein